MTNPYLNGVNLGGWLILEKWMTPTLFAGTVAVDEYTFMQSPDADRQIERHRRTFITEDDYRWMVKHQVNAVRIPVGYWVFEDQDGFTSTKKYLDWAMRMAKKYKIHTIIDLHGLKGSQNGYDHSGQVGPKRWFKQADYRQQSLDVLESIASRYRTNDYFYGLQTINEPPLRLFNRTLRRFYTNAYDRLSHILLPHTSIIFSDAYTPRLLSGALKRAHHPVMMDVHLYHMATWLAPYLPVEWYFNKVIHRHKILVKLSRDQPIIIGEWSGVMAHRTVMKVSGDQHQALFDRYFNLQRDLYQNFAGSFYWNYKTEFGGQWNYRSIIESKKG